MQSRRPRRARTQRSDRRVDRAVEARARGAARARRFRLRARSSRPASTIRTRAAIEKFERDRGLPVTGQISDRLVRELAAMTGRPLE